MKLFSNVLLGAGMLVLAACGGGEEAVTDNVVDTVAVPEEDVLAPTDGTLAEIPADSLGNETDLNTVDAGNAVDANVSVDANSQ